MSGETSDGLEPDLEIDNQQAKQMDDGAQSILAPSTPRAPGEEGLRDVRVIEAIIKAARSGASFDV